MKKKAFLGLLSLCLLLVASTSCKEKAKVEEKSPVAATEGSVQVPEEDVLTSTVLTAAEQAALKPADILNLLKEGNQEFIEDNLTVRNNSQRVRDAATGQFPIATVLSCLDSRVPVEDIFHRGIGDLFVARIAGNIVNEDILGSFEFATKVSGAKVIVVLGHEYCGAIKSAIDDVKLGNITALLAKIQPAVAAAGKTFEGEKTAANPAFVEAVCDHNVEIAMEQLRKKSPILKELEDKGELLIVGGVYDMKTGKVNFFENK